MDVVEATDWIGTGMKVFDISEPSSLIAAIEAGTRTGYGYWAKSKAH